MKRRLLALCLALVMLVTMLPGTVLAAEAPVLSVGTATVEAGGIGSVTVSISGNTGFDTISFQIAQVSGLTINSVSVADGICNGWNSDYAAATGKFSAYSTGDAVTTDGVVCTINFMADASTSGIITLTLEEDTNADGTLMLEDEAVEGVTFTAGSITVGSTAASTGITLAAAADNDNPVRVGATNPVKVNVGVGQAFAATEMTITYPSALMSFDKNNSTLGTATITDNGSGTLTLADYGENKTTGTDNYVLAFTVTATSATTAEFKVTNAGLGTGTSAVDANLTAVADADLGSVTIAIEDAQYTVTLPNDGLFYAENNVVVAGGTFTFYPEQTTGGYYDYTTPTATYADGSAATVTATADGTGWQIENVTGNVTIAAGSRTPKNYGSVTYDGTGADKVSNQTTTATYLTDITFTIPADVEPSTANGVKYEVAAKIGNTNYTFTDVTTNEDGSRTYKIPGASVIGAVTVTVTATTLEANKVTVSLGGNASADGTYEGATAGASVQIDKTDGSATLTVDTETGLNKGYTYNVSASAGTLTKNEDGTYTITGLTSDATITITKTINVEGVKNQVQIDGESKSFVTLDSESGSKMWLIQLPNHVENTTDAVYKYNGQQMYWSADHDKYVLVVISTEAPAINADMFTLETVTATPTVASNNWDVNKSGTVDANDAQLIWNMYKSVYTEFSTAADGSGATVEKFMLADANHDGVLNLDDAVVIINRILNITGTPAA